MRRDCSNGVGRQDVLDSGCHVADPALILIAHRHGLRVSELVSLRWDQIDLGQGLDQLIKQEPFWAPLAGVTYSSQASWYISGVWA